MSDLLEKMLTYSGWRGASKHTIVGCFKVSQVARLSLTFSFLAHELIFLSGWFYSWKAGREFLRGKDVKLTSIKKSVLDGKWILNSEHLWFCSTDSPPGRNEFGRH